MEKNNCCDSKKIAVKIKPKNAGINLSFPKGSQGSSSACCCGAGNECCPEPVTRYDKNCSWITGELQTSVGMVPQISTKLDCSDMLGSWKARWGINRMNYKINPGLYAVGAPDQTSPVLVTANYKMTFDMLRKELEGLAVWILVLDTKGINVWCAAGKGTFGTEELISRISKVKLLDVVSKRTLVLPQLGASGVCAHEVAKRTGFNVVYGPVRARDIKEFFNSGMKASAEMRTVRFTLYDRLVLTPIELVGSFKASLIIFGILFLLNLIGIGPFGAVDFYAYMGAVIAGCVLAPIMLPWIPGRAFALKGWMLGLIWAVIVNMLNGWPYALQYSWLRALGYLLILPSVAAFYAMNFTGASTYTSPSGVLKEMKAAVPVIIVTIFSGIVLIVINSFI